MSTTNEHTDATDQTEEHTVAESESEQTRPLPRVEPHNPAAPGGIVPRVGTDLVVDAEVVDEEDTAAPGTQIERRSRRVIEATGRLVPRPEQRARAGEVGRAAGKAVVRHGGYLYAGAGVVARRYRDSHGMARYERQMAGAEATGNKELLADWETRAEQAKRARAERRAQWASAPKRFAQFVLGSFVALIAALFVIGVVLAGATHDLGMVVAPFTATLALVNTVYTVGRVVFWPALVLAPIVGLGWLWAQGRHHSAWTPPAWMAPPGELPDASQDPITPSKIVIALRDLGISELRKAIKAMPDGGAGMLSAIRIAGIGIEVDVLLPSGGGTTEAVQGLRRRLAENLDRHEHELFISVPRPRTVRLWIADAGELDRPLGPSPLVTDPDATADLYTGRAPWGQTLRGELFALPLKQRHLLITGLSNQGKTAALRALVLWLLLDPTVELRCADLKGIGDWHMFDGIATRLIEGPSDEHAVAATHMLEAGVSEMERRLSALDPEKYPDGVTRELARSEQGFHPLVLLVDEAQQAFMCPAKDDAGTPYGGKASTSRYFMAARKLHNQGRAVNVILWQGTQDPTDQNLPKLVREGAHIRAALVLGTENQGRMALGEKAVNAGAAPHKLRQGLDKGTLVVTGDVPLPTGESSVTVRTNFISGDDATTIAERIKTARGARVTNPEQDEPTDRDLLTDVADVLGGQHRVKPTDVAARLRDHAPAHEPYRTLDGKTLATQLAAAGVRITLKDGTPQVYTERVHQAIANRLIDEETDE